MPLRNSTGQVNSRLGLVGRTRSSLAIPSQPEGGEAGGSHSDIRMTPASTPSRRFRNLREGDQPHRMSKALSLGLAALCLAGLAGCALPGSTQPVVKIGLVAPFEGWYRPRGYAALSAVRLAIREANRAGGVAGYQVELVALDDHLDPHWAPQRAREFVADPAVMGVVGCLSPATAQAARHVYSEAGLALITPASVEAQGDGVFVLAPAPERLAQVAMGHIRAQGAHRVALLYGGQREPWAKAARSWPEIVALVALDSPGWPRALAESGAEWVICPVDARLGAEALQHARSAGLRASFIGGPEWATDAFRKVAADAGSGAWFVTGGPQGTDLSGSEDFVVAYREQGSREPGPDAVLAYDATRLLLTALQVAIEREGCPTRQGVREALSQVSLLGVTGPIAFDPRGARVKARTWVYRAD